MLDAWDSLTNDQELVYKVTGHWLLWGRRSVNRSHHDF